jgi:hypothetical protein
MIAAKKLDADHRLCQPQVRQVVLKNNGRVPASFSFKPSARDGSVCKSFTYIENPVQHDRQTIFLAIPRQRDDPSG